MTLRNLGREIKYFLFFSDHLWVVAVASWTGKAHGGIGESKVHIRGPVGHRVVVKQGRAGGSDAAGG